MHQLTYEQTHNERHEFPLVVVCENFHSPDNVGMAFRLCEIFGVRHLYLTGSSPCPPNQKIRRVARTADQKVHFSHFPTPAKCIDLLKQQNFRIIGLEITDQSEDIRKFEFGKPQKMALVVGAERYGISTGSLNLLDAAVQIPMFGSIGSMNVATALSVGLYEVIRQWSLVRRG